MFYFHSLYRTLLEEYSRLKGMKQSASFDNGSVTSESSQDAVLIAEANNLRQHKGRLEARMLILEDHNRQLESQLQRLRQLLEQVLNHFLLYLNPIFISNV